MGVVQTSEILTPFEYALYFFLMRANAENQCLSSNSQQIKTMTIRTDTLPLISRNRCVKYIKHPFETGTLVNQRSGVLIHAW